MTPQEKAKELIERFGLAFGESYGYNKEKAKACALIAVEEMIKELDGIYTRETAIASANYEKVKEEIEDL